MKAKQCQEAVKKSQKKAPKKQLPVVSQKEHHMHQLIRITSLRLLIQIFDFVLKFKIWKHNCAIFMQKLLKNILKVTRNDHDLFQYSFEALQKAVKIFNNFSHGGHQRKQHMAYFAAKKDFDFLQADDQVKPKRKRIKTKQQQLLRPLAENPDYLEQSQEEEE